MSITRLRTRAEIAETEKAILLATRMLQAANQEALIGGAGVARDTLAMAFATAVKGLNDIMPGFRKTVIDCIDSVEVAEATRGTRQ